MILGVGEFKNFVSFVFAWWRHVMTSCHDVKNWLYSISACRSTREMLLFLFLKFFGSPSLKVLSFLCLHDVMTSWRDVMTSQNSFLLYQLVDVLKWWYTCISVNIRVMGSKQSSCMYLHDIIMSKRDVMTLLKLLHDVKKRTAFISACKCARGLISFSFL